MKEAINNSDKKLSEIDILDKKEREKILFEFNNTNVVFQKNKSIHDLFQEQVALFPDKDALVFGNNAMTYTELNQRSNKIARYLKDHGVKRGSCVALMVERSFDMIVLLVTKLNDAFSNLMPSHPLL